MTTLPIARGARTDATSPSVGFWRRHAALLLPAGDRVPGVDLARGLAILGMFAAHVGHLDGDFSTGAGWLSFAHGRSSILFALIAGISLALVSGRREPTTGVRGLQARTRILVRAVLLLAIAGLLDLLNTPVALILGFYAAYFVLALPFLRWAPSRLFGLALAIAVLGPPLVYYGPEVLARAGFVIPMDGTGAIVVFAMTGTYPALVWMAYVLAGLAVGRLDLASRRLQRVLLVAGSVVALVAYALSALVTGSSLGDVVAGTGPVPAIEDRALAGSGLHLPAPLPWTAPLPTSDYLWLAGPHTDTTLEVLGSGGFALAVLGLCLLLGSRRPVLRVLAPLAAVGSMALTVYCLQIVAIWAWEDQLMTRTGNGELLLLVIASLAFATVWRWWFGRGPLERFVGWVAARAASIPAPHGAHGAASSLAVEDDAPTRRDAVPTAPPTSGGDVQSGA